MKLRLGKRIAAVCLSFVMLVAACFTAGLSTAVPVQAATEKEVTLGAGVLAASCNTANAAKVWYGYNDANANKDKYVWRVVGYNGNDNGVAAEAGKMTLLANGNILEDTAYDETGRNVNLYGNRYGGSTLENNVNAIAGELLGTELSAVLKRTLIGGSGNQGEGGYNPYYISGTTVQDAVMWPLAEFDYLCVHKDLACINDPWWLCSPGTSNIYVMYVKSDGGSTDNSVNYRKYGVRPAFHLDLSPVLFSSLISGTAGTSNAEYKLTLKQDSSSMSIATNGNPSWDGSTITVPYSITGSLTANRVSVLITDKAYTAADARILQYGKLNVSGTFGSTGTGTFTIDNNICSGVWGTDFHVYILAEEVHLGNDIQMTDYASAPVEITAKRSVTITAANGTWVYDGTAHSNTTVELTAGNLVTGDALVAEASGSVTNVSDTADGNNPVAAGYKIMRGTVDVTAEYNITTVPGKLTIMPLSVSGAAVTLNSSQLQYNESEQTVGISSVVANGTTLTEGVDFTVSGNKATDIGNYTVTITGTNNCTGSVTAAWSIIEPANNTPVYVPSTPDPEPTPVSDDDTRTYNNPDGSVTTNTTNRHDNGSVTVEEKTEFEDGSFTLVSETKDKDGNLIYHTDETKTISKKGTAVVTTKTVNANGSTLDMVVKTTKKGHIETSSVATQATKKGNTIVTVSMTDSDGYELSMGFTVKKGVVTLTSFEASEGLITIPDEITANGVTIPVAAILKGTFKNNTTIINATIGRNVTVIGSKAFYGAKNLKNILVYGDLEKVGKGAFKSIAKDALIKIKADKENFNRIVELIKASGIGKNVKFKRLK